MAQQGIYVSPDNIVPNRDRGNKQNLYLYVCKYNIAYGNGMVLVAARNPNAEEANQILIANGMYNGSPQDYLITKTEEIVVPPCCGLMAKQTVEFFNNN